MENKDSHSPPKLGHFLCQRRTLVNYEILINLPQLKCPEARIMGRNTIQITVDSKRLNNMFLYCLKVFHYFKAAVCSCNFKQQKKSSLELSCSLCVTVLSSTQSIFFRRIFPFQCLLRIHGLFLNDFESVKSPTKNIAQNVVRNFRLLGAISLLKKSKSCFKRKKFGSSEIFLRT